MEINNGFLFLTAAPRSHLGGFAVIRAPPGPASAAHWSGVCCSDDLPKVVPQQE